MRSFFRREPGFYRHLVALALPILIQNLITNSLGLVDTFMVGTLGEGPLAGVTLANIPVFVVQLMMFGIQSGSAVLISQYRGKGDFASINRVMGIGMYVAGAITLITPGLITDAIGIGLMVVVYILQKVHPNGPASAAAEEQTGTA